MRGGVGGELPPSSLAPPRPPASLSLVARARPTTASRPPRPPPRARPSRSRVLVPWGGAPRAEGVPVGRARVAPPPGLCFDWFFLSRGREGSCDVLQTVSKCAQLAGSSRRALVQAPNVTVSTT